MPAFSYVVTSSKPTSVSNAVVGSFTAPGARDLIVAKTSRLELFSIEADGLSPLFEVQVYGRISSMETFRPAGQERDLLCLLTEKMQLSVISYDASTNELVTVAMCDAQDRIGRPVESGPVLITDPGSRLVAMHLYDNLLKVVDTRGGRFADLALNVRLEEMGVVDIAFLHNAPQSGSSSAAAAGAAAASGGAPVLALLHEDADGGKHVSTYTVDIDEASLSPGPWRVALGPADIDAHALIPVPGTRAGVIVAGGSGFRYKDASSDVRAETSELTVTAFAPLGPESGAFLVGDAGGRAHRVQLKQEGAAVTGIEVSMLGSTSIASALCPLFRMEDPTPEMLAEAEEAGEEPPAGAGWQVFVGSGFGDSQLVSVTDAELSAEEGFVREEAAYDSLGPITDMAVMDLGRQGQCQVVTCSGAFKDGSLRVVRNGVGVEERAVVGLQGVRGLWALRSGFGAADDALLVSGYAASTRVLALGEAVEEVEPAGLQLGAASLLCANVVSVDDARPAAAAGGSAAASPAALDALVQATATEVRLTSADGATLLSSWSPPAGTTVTTASAAHCQVAVALSGGRLVLLDVCADGTLRQAAEAIMPQEVSSLCITPLLSGAGAARAVSAPAGDAQGAEDGSAHSRPVRVAGLAAVGLWESNTVQLLRLPSLEPAGAPVTLSEEYQSRAAQLVTMDGVDRLFVGMGDGTLVHFVVDAATGALTSRSVVQVGSRPITLDLHGGEGTPSPSHDSDAGPPAPAGHTHVLVAGDRPTAVSSKGGSLLFSNINAGAVECMTGFSSAGMPGGLALAAPDTLTLGTVDSIQKLHIETVPLGGEQPRRIAALPESGAVAVATLSSYETGGGDVVETAFLRQFLVLGTAIVDPDEDDPSRGRLLVFRVPALSGAAGGSVPLEPVAVQSTRGGVFALEPACGRIVAGINSRVAVFALAGRSGAAAAPADASGATGATSSAGAAAASAPLSLVAECSFGGHTLALHLALAGGLSTDPRDRAPDGSQPYADLAVGDLIKSVSVLRYSKEDKALVEIARDPSTNWLTALACPGNDRFLACDSSFNLFSLERNTGGVTDEERGHLSMTGTFHLGDQVNRFRSGSLVMLPPNLAAPGEVQRSSDAESGTSSSSSSSSAAVAPAAADGGAASSSSAGVAAAAAAAAAAGSDPSADKGGPVVLQADVPRPQFLFGTVSGAIGAVISLPTAHFHFLRRLQQALAETIPGVGGLPHSGWRAWASAQLAYEPMDPDPALGFIDGDLIERLLDLPPATVEVVAAAMNALQGFPPSSLHCDGRLGGPATAAELVAAAEEMARLH
ncbi:hypothetical protein FNF28_02529 [Cafeteria roenbergensis]|uniref:DNA damage-binding protein 1 n=1 Tax=Cafeteria roenbergensis TaxID=33653 RepID=A0A5A8DT55_CAFRO|nr:hypothetical protein FNF28_02529 [Cafeteria roenbergensis]